MHQQQHRRRKHLKPKHRMRMWSHQLKDAALTIGGQGGLGVTLRGLPRRAPTDEEVRSWVAAPGAQHAYEALWARARQHLGDRRSQSVAQGECFALFALTHAARATKALEIGTHLGFSTLHIAAALAHNGTPAKLTTVDIIDVNDEQAARYRRSGASMSARQRLRLIGLEDRVDFVVSSSEAYLKRTADRYDVIFVDGDHSEAAAYFDIMRGLSRLNDNGIIILHDYNDPDDPTPGIRSGQYGVHWAIHRLQSHIPDIGVVRLRSVLAPGNDAPVPTSLAVVTRRSPAV